MTGCCLSHCLLKPLRARMAEAHGLDEAIWKNLKVLGYGG